MRYLAACDGIGAVYPAWQVAGSRLWDKGRDTKHGHTDRGSAAGQTAAPAPGVIAAEPVLNEWFSPDTEPSGPNAGPKEKVIP